MEYLKKVLGYALKYLEFLLVIPPVKFIWRLLHYIKIFGFKKGLYYIKKEISGSTELIGFSYKGNTISIRLNSSDIYVLMNIVIYEEYRLDLKRSPEYIVDAGAYTGISTVYFAEKYPDATIIAIEPDKNNFMLLKENTKNFKKVKCINNALWFKTETVEMTDRDVGHWGFTMRNFKTKGNGKSSEIKSVNIPWIMKNYDIDYIDLLKVDIEGSEKEVLENSSDWINNVGVIAVELHDRINKGCKHAFYNATGSFEYKLKKGENVFKLRKSYFQS